MVELHRKGSVCSLRRRLLLICSSRSGHQNMALDDVSLLHRKYYGYTIKCRICFIPENKFCRILDLSLNASWREPEGKMLSRQYILHKLIYCQHNRSSTRTRLLAFIVLIHIWHEPNYFHNSWFRTCVHTELAQNVALREGFKKENGKLSTFCG